MDKREKLYEEMQALVSKMAEVEEEIDGTEDEKVKEHLAKKLADMSADFEAKEKEVERIDAKSKRDERLAALKPQKADKTVEGKKADLEDPKVEIPDTEHNANVYQAKKDKASWQYLTGKSGDEALASIASQSGDELVKAITLARVENPRDANAIVLPKRLRDYLAPKPTAERMILGKAGSNDVTVSDASGSASGGGSLVDTDFDARLYKREVNLVHDIAGKCYVKRAVGKQAIFPKLSQDSTTPFGVAITRGDGSAGQGEGAAITESNPVFSQVTVNTGRMACLAQASLKEVRTADVGFEAELAWMFRNATAFAYGQDVIEGSYSLFNGCGLPLGISDRYSIDTLSVQTLARETASQVSYTDAARMPFSVDEGVTDEGMFILSGGSSGAARYMFTLDDSTGHPVFEGQDASWRVSPRGPSGTIAGRPYLRTKANSKAVGARGDVIYGNLRHYAFVIDTDNMAVERSDHYAFNAGLVTFRLITYVGGRVLDGHAFVVLDDIAGVSSSDSSST